VVAAISTLSGKTKAMPPTYPNLPDVLRQHDCQADRTRLRVVEGQRSSLSMGRTVGLLGRHVFGAERRGCNRSGHESRCGERHVRHIISSHLNARRWMSSVSSGSVPRLASVSALVNLWSFWSRISGGQARQVHEHPDGSQRQYSRGTLEASSTERVQASG